MAENTEKILEIKVNYSDAIKKIAEYKTKIDALKDSEAELKKQLKNGEISRQQYNEELTASKTLTNEYNSTIRSITKTIQNQIKQEKEQAGSLKALRAELSNLIDQYDSLSEIDRKGDIGAKLKKNIDSLTESVKKGEEETERYQRNVGNYKNAILEAIGVNGELSESIMNLTNQEAGVRGMFSQVKDSAFALGGALKALIANPLFLAVAGIVGTGMAFKWWYDYNMGLQEATRLTKQFTGMSGDELKAYRNEIQAVADAFGVDFKENLSAVNAMSKQFGISYEEALQNIKDGFIAGADANGEFLKGVEEYSTFFKEAGISADQFVSIIAQTNKMGIFSDKGIDAIKEANIRLREMVPETIAALDGIGISSKKVQEELQNGSKTTFDIMQEVSEKLNELPDSSSKVGAAIADIFGGPGEDAGLQYIRTLKDISVNLDEVKEQSGELGQLQEEQLQSQIELQNALDGLFDQTGGNFERLNAQAKIFANKSLTAIIKAVISIINYFIDLYNKSLLIRGIWQLIVVNFKNSIDTIGNLFRLLIDVITSLGETLKGAFTLDWDLVKKGTVDFAKSFATLVKSQVKDIKKNVNEGIDSLQGQIKPIKVPLQVGDGKQTSTTTTRKITTQTSTSSGSGDANKAAEAQKKAAEEELKEIRKAEDEMLSLIQDNLEKQRAKITTEYDRQIEYLKTRLATEKNLTEKSKEAINQQIIALEQQKNNELQKLSDEELQKEVANRQKLIELQLESVKKGSEEELNLKLQLLETQKGKELSNKELTEEMKLAIINKYNAQAKNLYIQHEKELNAKLAQEVSLRMENEILQMQEKGASELEILQEQADQKLELLNSIQQQEGETDEEFLNRRLEAQQAYTDAKQEVVNKEVEIEQTKYQAASDITSSLVGLLNTLGEKNKGLAIASKVLALAEIAINSGKAIAAGVAQAQSVPFPANIAAIATTVATILANITTAITTVKSAKFATGGLVTGPGTGTSDSIDAKLSNGESVMTARATEMFGPILSSFNQMGGGVPINVSESSSQAIGEDMMARAFAKGMKNFPAPVVSVDEINRVGNRVKVLESLGSV
jgi:hypothetical protein